MGQLTAPPGQGPAPPAMSRSQRWRDRRDSFVPNAEPFHRSDYAADVINDRLAKKFCVEHHYSGSYPATRLAVGMFRNGAAGRSELVGVAAFSVPQNNAVITRWTQLADPSAGVELGRFVILDDVPGNAESSFLARARRLLRFEKPTIQSILSYADPVRRVDSAGRVTLPGHAGLIYSMVFGATPGGGYKGRSARRTIYLMPDGRSFSGRAMSKVRTGETGQGYAVDQLLAQGAPRPITDDLRTWLDGLIRQGFFRCISHPGSLAFVLPLTHAASLAARRIPSLPAPRLDRSVVEGDVTTTPLFGAIA